MFLLFWPFKPYKKPCKSVLLRNKAGYTAADASGSAISPIPAARLCAWACVRACACVCVCLRARVCFAIPCHCGSAYSLISAARLSMCMCMCMCVSVSVRVYMRVSPLHFLDASSHLYKRVCPSVGPSVSPSVHP